MTALTEAQKAAFFDALVADGAIDLSRLLTDMSATLARVMEAELDDLSEPVWLNPDTGMRASSLSAILRILGLSCSLEGGATLH